MRLGEHKILLTFVGLYALGVFLRGVYSILTTGLDPASVMGVLGAVAAVIVVGEVVACVGEALLPRAG